MTTSAMSPAAQIIARLDSYHGSLISVLYSGRRDFAMLKRPGADSRTGCCPADGGAPGYRPPFAVSTRLRISPAATPYCSAPSSIAADDAVAKVEVPARVDRHRTARGDPVGDVVVRDARPPLALA